MCIYWAFPMHSPIFSCYSFSEIFPILQDIELSQRVRKILLRLWQSMKLTHCIMKCALPYFFFPQIESACELWGITSLKGKFHLAV